MKNLTIEGGVEGVGASQGYQGISILYNTLDQGTYLVPNMTTHWQLTKEEIAMLILGGKLEVSILGEPGSWPPIMLGVATDRIEIGMERDDAEFLHHVAAVFTQHIDGGAEYADRLRRIATKL